MREPALLTVSAFTADVAAGTPVPAGGSASALTGSVAAALVTMVCRVSLGREGVVAKNEELRKALEQSERLRCRLSSRSPRMRSPSRRSPSRRPRRRTTVISARREARR